VNPLVNWVWFGGVLLTLGTFIAAWPAAAGKPALDDGSAGSPDQIGSRMKGMRDE